jgi:hypothetical protein
MSAPLIDLPAPSLVGYTAEQIAFARQAWPMRAAEELRSALMFRALGRAVHTVGGALWAGFGATLKRVVGDELRHTRLCVTVGAALGASAPAWDRAMLRARLGALPAPRLRAGALLLVEAAIGETVSSLLFRAGRRAAVEPLTRAALTSILGDEVRHARLGWSALATLWPALDGAERAALQREAAAGLGALERTVALPALRRLDAGEPFDPAHAALGVLAPESRVDAFYQAVERLVIPRLGRLGLDGEAAWRDRYRVSTDSSPRA